MNENMRIKSAIKPYFFNILLIHIFSIMILSFMKLPNYHVEFNKITRLINGPEFDVVAKSDSLLQ